MSVIEACMLGACPDAASGELNELIGSLIIASREACKVREIALIAGTAKQETRIFLRCDLSQVRCSH
jgi:hypothetical protein